VKDELQERLGANEAVFRKINEGIERGQWPGEEDAPVGFRCECAQLGCTELIELTVREYEQVREDARRFIVLPGHELLEAEVVIENRPGYLVVQKIDQAGETAIETDPRG
jgi:hypothetical protein